MVPPPQNGRNIQVIDIQVEFLGDIQYRQELSSFHPSEKFVFNKLYTMMEWASMAKLILHSILHE